MLVDDLWCQDHRSVEWLERENARLRAQIAALHEAIATQQAEFVDTLQELGVYANNDSYPHHCANASRKIVNLGRLTDRSIGEVDA